MLPIVFCCDGKARATPWSLPGIASWVTGKCTRWMAVLGAWVAAGRPLESGLSVGAAFDGSITGVATENLGTAG